VGESDSAFRRARVDQKTELRTKAIEPEDGALFSFAELYYFMYDNYEPQYWWFECFDYLRRLALTGLMVIVLPGSALQGFIGVLIALGGLLSYNTFQPFVDLAQTRPDCCRLNSFVPGTVLPSRALDYRSAQFIDGNHAQTMTEACTAIAGKFIKN